MSNKKNNKNIIPVELAEKIKGFEEIFGEYLTEYQKQSIIKNSHVDLQLKQNVKTYDFLENEFKRLNKINKLFSFKISNATSYAQTPSLIKAQQVTKAKLEKKILDIFIDSNSNLHRQLSHIFDQLSFKSKK